MEQTALRPKPLPGSESAGGAGPGGPARRPHAARRRGRRLATLLFGLSAGAVLVLTGVGLGTVGATVIGMSRLAELQRQAGPGGPGAASTPARPGPAAPDGSPGTATASPRPPDATLGLEAVDAEHEGAEIVAVHIPGPGYTAGLVRGDVVVMFGGTRIESATDLARAVDEARPGQAVKVTVRHGRGGYGRLTVVPGVVT
ncbi:S1-C subfamily serine protease [Streptomyces sp. 3330]|uniref:PDZ domain-containing protein n=1 Tax=Streptomyces sp. 3330 TaxID=2817755 RepID=UPI00285A2DBF|nr:PDZ domain-containing protein [Streptomyces sp. 3330]MDR6979997.1 S1-C subfamily serine protease [Streptomyces sp. 3330]